MVSRTYEAAAMTVCPVALAVGCRKCPVFAVCPAKSLIGDHKPNAPDEPDAGARKKPEGKGGRGR